MGAIVLHKLYTLTGKLSHSSNCRSIYLDGLQPGEVAMPEGQIGGQQGAGIAPQVCKVVKHTILRR